MRPKNPKKPPQTWAEGQHFPLTHVWPEGQHVPEQDWPEGQHFPLMHVWPEGQHVLPQQARVFSQQWSVQQLSSLSQTLRPQHV